LSKNLPLSRFGRAYFVAKNLTIRNPTPSIVRENKADGSGDLKKSQVMERLSEAHIYVGTYAKYNEGSIFGKWMDLSDFSDKSEFLAACRELHQDESDPELMFQDWENIPSALISESWLSDNIFEIIDVVSELSETQQEAFSVWLNYTNHDIVSEDITDLLVSFEEDYQGEFQNEEDYAYDLVEQCYDLPEFAKTYFDYKKFARDLFIGDYWYDNGFVFRRT
jgi:antirestriction protein